MEAKTVGASIATSKDGTESVLLLGVDLETLLRLAQGEAQVIELAPIDAERIAKLKRIVLAPAGNPADAVLARANTRKGNGHA